MSHCKSVQKERECVCLECNRVAFVYEEEVIILYNMEDRIKYW